ncbi:MAG: 4-hydroxythreonine-4-phosphate dehydrogenase PdxA, partial [Bacteroidales bacterium]|nr:4-hydroxythreonine-4-phosphate dehydrogenase PdxA [Bacteroidales bacterium]
VLTGHVPLSRVSGLVTKELVLTKLRLLNESLKIDFGIRKPNIAVLGLNPHAGDNGFLGHEEIEIIEPALEEARNEGILAIGTFPADGFFGSASQFKFDAVLAMYHDQGLAPFKSIVTNGVNYTAGLSIVRTSPAHGTGFDIAGKGLSSPDSFRNALYLALDILKQRRNYKELTEDPLQMKGQGNGR